MAEFVTPRALETREIAEVVEQFRVGAANAREAGFDGVELHGANGYLINQFLDSSSNRRTDAYGGSAEKRARFLLEVTRAAAEEIGGERVGVRLSPGGTFNDVGDADPAETYGYAVRELNRLGLGYLHLVNSLPGVVVGTREGRPVGAVEFLRPLWDGTLVATGGYDRESAEAALDAGLADLIGFARLYLANPDLLDRFEADAELNPHDRATFYGGGEKGYVDYPALAAEAA
jgi:N-ethylmaleimide reductase